MNPKSPKEILLNLSAACENRRLELDSRHQFSPSREDSLSLRQREDNLRDLREVFYNAAVALSDPTQ